MTAAVVDLATTKVVNIIVADPAMDPHPVGHLLVAVPDGVPVDSRWVWNETDGFKPGSELQAELERLAAAEQQAVEQEAWA
jgi:hypothetical protein